MEKGVAIPLREAFDRRFFYSFLLLVLLYLVCLWGNGWNPLLTMDSSRYAPGEEALRPFGSTLPKLLNTPLYQLGGLAGSAVTGLLFLSFGLARLISASMHYFGLEYTGWKDRKVWFVTLVTGFFSFAPFYAIMIMSEPYSMAFFSLLCACLLSGRMSFVDAVFLLLTACTHSSNICVGMTVLLIYGIFFRHRVRLSVMITVLMLGSMVLDRLYYDYKTSNGPRFEKRYILGVILDNYSFVLEETCKDTPSFALCANPHFLGYMKQRASRESRVRDDHFRYGGWMTFLDIMKASNAWPGPYRISGDFLDRIAPELIRRFFVYLPHHLGEAVHSTLKNGTFAAVAMFFTKPDPHYDNHDRLTVLVTCRSEDYRPNVIKYADGTYRLKERPFFNTNVNPFCINESCWYKKMKRWDSDVILAHYTIFLTALLLLLRKNKYRKKILFLCVTCMTILFVNAAFTGIVAGIFSRYHYRLFFLVTLPVSIMLVLLGGQIRERWRIKSGWQE